MEKKEMREKARGVLSPVVGIFAAMGVPPIMVTIIGVLLSLYGALVTAKGSLFLGGLFLLLSGLCDVVDGSLARRQQVTSSFGAFFDSVSDRVTEFAYYGGIGYYFVFGTQEPGRFALVFCFLALAGSVLTSYARARAEGIGVSCRVGFLERPERVGLLTLGLLLGRRILMLVIVFLAVATVMTFIQRVIHVQRQTRLEARPDDGT